MEYENYKLCSQLKTKECRIVLEQYSNRRFDRVFHQHVRSSRLSRSSKIELLKALVVRHTPLSSEAIVSAYVNGRGDEPSRSGHFRIVIRYPEAGAMRTYCGANTVAWIDDVISPSDFRVAT